MSCKKGERVLLVKREKVLLVFHGTHPSRSPVSTIRNASIKHDEKGKGGKLDVGREPGTKTGELERGSVATQLVSSMPLVNEPVDTESSKVTTILHPPMVEHEEDSA